jgi:Inositol polyphosphate kinase
MEQPCVMDIKIGRQTWDPEATDAKIQKEMVNILKLLSIYQIKK